MTAPNQQSIQIVRGDDYGAIVTFDQLVATFSTMRLTVRETWATTETDNTSAVFTVALVADVDPYQATLDIPSATTLDMQSDEYVYDIAVLTTGGKRYTTQRGTIRMIADSDRS